MEYHKNEFLKYLVWVFALGIASQLAALHFGLEAGGRVWLWVTMWTPAIAVLLVSPSTRRAIRRSLHVRGLKFVPLGLGVGWCQILLARLLLVLTGRYRWDVEHFPLAPDGGGVSGIHGLATVLGPHPQGFAFLALNLFLSIAVASLFSGIIGGLGEELGWRGYLQPTLESRKGPWQGTVWVGLIWAFWHLPANLAGYNDAAHPILSTFVLFPVGVVSLAFAFAWLYRFSGGTIWAVAVAHGANNVLDAGFVVEASDWWSGQAATLSASVAMIVIFGALLTKHRPAVVSSPPATLDS